MDEYLTPVSLLSIDLICKCRIEGRKLLSVSATGLLITIQFRCADKSCNFKLGVQGRSWGRIVLANEGFV